MDMHRRKIAPTARFAEGFCSSLRFLPQNLALIYPEGGAAGHFRGIAKKKKRSAFSRHLINQNKITL